MENKEIIETSASSSDLVKKQNKENWLGQIMLKQIQGLPLSEEEWGFYMNMFVNAKDADIERLAKGSIVELQKIAEEAKGEVPVEVYWGLKQRDTHLIQSLLKTVKQGRKDDSQTRKNNLSTFNRMVKEAKKKGGFYTDGESFVDTADDVVDLTEKKGAKRS